MAKNILDLRAAGANVILDDVQYLSEPAFQDGAIAQAVNMVTASGALYFASAGNNGNLKYGTAGVYEGDFVGTAKPAAVPGTSQRSVIAAQSFGGSNFDKITADPPSLITLEWADPIGGAENDYDLWLLSADRTTIVDASFNTQNGNDDPFEETDSKNSDDNGRCLVVTRSAGAARFIRLDAGGGRLAVTTSGQIAGHAAAANAFAVGAVRASTASGGAFVGGSTNPVEAFVSDGPRRLFFSLEGQPLTPGNFSSTGGIVRQKPDIAAADGVKTATPGFTTFFGTSAAAPHAGAVAALLLQSRPDLRNAVDASATSAVRGIFNATALDIEGAGLDLQSGVGIVMADRVTAACAAGEGASCDDADPCTTSDKCHGGFCQGTPVVCAALDACHDAGVCEPLTGVCSNPAKADGTPCSDGNACTKTDRCQSGTCQGTTAVTCEALDACHDAGVCDPATGVCSNPAMPDGTSCNDGNACTELDICVGGTCDALLVAFCEASDACHEAGVCNPATGLCSNPAKPDGTACNDGNACTQADSCQAGTCAGTNAVVCQASDQCHEAGVCDPSTGVCTNPAKPDRTPCNDGNACTELDICWGGVCEALLVAVCLASDACHEAGVCDPLTGACSNPARPDDTPCDDADACTQTDTCQAGVCQGSLAVDCSPLDDCHAPGTCNPNDGSCSHPQKPDGTPCAGGACAAGACMPIVDAGGPTPIDDGGSMSDAADSGSVTDAAPQTDDAEASSNDAALPESDGPEPGEEAAPPGDAGPEPDASDAGPADAPVEARGSSDALAPDAARDAGHENAPNTIIVADPSTGNGCACRVGAGPEKASGGWLGLVGAAFLAGRRRARARLRGAKLTSE
jgi:MYXO-CTERM domain-containing protein